MNTHICGKSTFPEIQRKAIKKDSFQITLFNIYIYIYIEGIRPTNCEKNFNICLYKAFKYEHIYSKRSDHSKKSRGQL